MSVRGSGTGFSVAVQIYVAVWYVGRFHLRSVNDLTSLLLRVYRAADSKDRLWSSHAPTANLPLPPPRSSLNGCCRGKEGFWCWMLTRMSPRAGGGVCREASCRRLLGGRGQKQAMVGWCGGAAAAVDAAVAVAVVVVRNWHKKNNTIQRTQLQPSRSPTRGRSAGHRAGSREGPAGPPPRQGAPLPPIRHPGTAVRRTRERYDEREDSCNRLGMDAQHASKYGVCTLCRTKQSTRSRKYTFFQRSTHRRAHMVDARHICILTHAADIEQERQPATRFTTTRRETATTFRRFLRSAI